MWNIFSPFSTLLLIKKYTISQKGTCFNRDQQANDVSGEKMRKILLQESCFMLQSMKALFVTSSFSSLSFFFRERENSNFLKYFGTLNAIVGNCRNFFVFTSFLFYLYFIFCAFLISQNF